MKKVQLTENALKVLESRYLQKDREGILKETPEQLFARVARHIAQAEQALGGDKEKWETIFFDMMCSLEFLPNSPTLMNAGLELNQLSACFVLPIADNMESIFTTLKNTALIQQSGGGTGFNFSNLRPEGAFIASTSGHSSGPVAFMKVYDAATQNIKQGGKRRGANMGILNIDHPDIEEFITVKQTEGVLSNFNISVGMYDRFMEAVLLDGDWELKMPGTGMVVKKMKARALWQKIVANAWQSGDPGLVFLDTINAANPTPSLGRMDCTNPCGEIPLMPYEACNLGSVNVTKFVNKDKTIDWEALKTIVQRGVRFLDNVIEVNNYVIPEIEKMVKGNRKIGLGIMGWAEMLLLLDIPYASEEAVQLGSRLMAFINETASEASGQLAIERGNFGFWKESVYHGKGPMRNATRTCIAPTGTISIIAGTSSSIEPLFALALKRENVLNNQTLYEMNPVFLSILEKKGLVSEQILTQVNSSGSVAATTLPHDLKQLFLTSLEISPKWHIRHQVAFQQHTDNAVSKTINLPENASVKEVEEAYMLAWRSKAKGVTVFRTGSRKTQVLNSGLEHQGSCQVCAT